jgi:hypothetical protein
VLLGSCSGDKLQLTSNGSTSLALASSKYTSLAETPSVETDLQDEVSGWETAFLIVCMVNGIAVVLLILKNLTTWSPTIFFGFMSLIGLVQLIFSNLTIQSNAASPWFVTCSLVVSILVFAIGLACWCTALAYASQNKQSNRG